MPWAVGLDRHSIPGQIGDLGLFRLERAVAGDDAFPVGEFVVPEMQVEFDVAQYFHQLDDRHARSVFTEKYLVDFSAVTNYLGTGVDPNDLSRPVLTGGILFPRGTE